MTEQQPGGVYSNVSDFLNQSKQEFISIFENYH